MRKLFTHRCASVLALAALAACMPTGTDIVLSPASVPPTGIYGPQDVRVSAHTNDVYEFAAGGSLDYSAEQVKRVAYCAASEFAVQNHFNGWFVKDTVDNSTAYMREMNVIAGFYRGEKPPLVDNLNGVDWCSVPVATAPGYPAYQPAYQ